MDNVKAQNLRNAAFRKLKEDRSMFPSDEKKEIKSILTGAWYNLSRQVFRDISMYVKYDCLAMWLDWESGLVKYEPDIIERIATEVGGLNVE